MLSEVYKHKGKVGFTCSTFDLLHAGHCAMLSEAKSHCDILVVGLQVDPTVDRPEKNAPIQSIFERWVQLQAIRDVDYIIPYSTEKDLIDLLHTLNPCVRILGEEYQNTKFTGFDITKIEHIFNKRDHSFSSSSLRTRVQNAKVKS